MKKMLRCHPRFASFWGLLTEDQHDGLRNIFKDFRFIVESQSLSLLECYFYSSASLFEISHPRKYFLQ